jgi:hypothetical protein
MFKECHNGFIKTKLSGNKPLAPVVSNNARQVASEILQPHKRVLVAAVYAVYPGADLKVLVIYQPDLSTNLGLKIIEAFIAGGSRKFNIGDNREEPIFNLITIAESINNTMFRTHAGVEYVFVVLQACPINSLCMKGTDKNCQHQREYVIEMPFHCFKFFSVV